MDILFRGILKLQTVEDCYDFLKICARSPSCVPWCSAFRWRACWMRGRIYSDIVQETGASTATISRVNKCLV